MEIINKSRKIIGISGEPLLPGATVELPDGAENHPVIADYLAKGILVDAKKEASGADNNGINDAEKARIAQEAVAEYKKEQEALAAEKAAKETEIKAVKDMKKMELLTKAVSMGLEVKDDDTVDILREKIISVLEK